MLEVIFDAAVRCGQLPAHLPARETSEAMHAFISGLMRSWIERRDFDLQRTAPWLVDTFLTGLKNAPRTILLPAMTGPVQTTGPPSRGGFVVCTYPIRLSGLLAYFEKLVVDRHRKTLAQRCKISSKIILRHVWSS
jgi:hypothetical protein